MADRRPDDTPLAPRRSLGGRDQGDDKTDARSAKKPLSARVSAAVSSAGARITPSTEEKPPDEKSPRSNSSASAKPASRAGSRQKSPERETAAQPQKTAGRSARPRKPRRARLRLTHIDPWSVMKTAFLLSIAIGIVTVVAVALVWAVLGAAGVWDSINATVQDVLGEETSEAFDIETYVGTSRVIGFTMIVAVVDVILITAVATLGAFLYNLSAALLGGVEVTLAEDDN